MTRFIPASRSFVRLPVQPLERALVMTLLVLAAGCGGAGPDSGEIASVSLVPVDSVGIELGDARYVFGVIASVEFLPDGRLLVLDANSQTLRVYSPGGEYMSEYGGPGEAPGEFLSPGDIAVLDEGLVVVTDPRASEFDFFDADTGFVRTLAGFSPRAPFIIDGGDGMIVGHQGLFDREQGRTGESLAAWSPESARPAVVFIEEWSRFDPDDMAARFMEPDPPMEISGSLVFYAPLEWERYGIMVYDAEGNSRTTLERPGYSPVRKTPEELAGETELFEQRRAQMLAMGRGGRAMAGQEYSPSEYHYAVASLGLDREGRLWARRGHADRPLFDLFNPETGEWLCLAEGPSEMNSWTFVVTRYGIAAYEEDPLDYPRIVLLNF